MIENSTDSGNVTRRHAGVGSRAMYWTRLAEVWSQLLVWLRGLRRGNHAPVDYRERISVATWLIMFGLGGSLLVELPTIVVHAWAFGSPVSIPFTGAVWFVLFLSILAAAGAQSIVSVHPKIADGWYGARLSTWPFWALPMALTGITVILLPIAPSVVVQVLAILFSGAVIALAYFGLYMTVDVDAAESRRARLLLDVLAYSSALVLFLFIYQTRTRSLLSGTLIALIAMLLAVEVLRSVAKRPLSALLYGGIIGLLLGQVTWALNYWLLPGLTGGLLLLLIFYLLIGIAQQGMQQRLNQRVLIEFGAFTLLALALIAWVGPGFG